MNLRIFSNAIIIVCLYFAAIVSILSDSLTVIALYMAIPVAFLLSFIKCERIAPNRYVTLLLLLYVWDALSSLWALYPVTAYIELKRVLGAFLFSYIIAVNGMERSMLKYLYVVFIILYIGAWIYAQQNSLIVEEIDGNQRLHDDKLNANKMAYYTFHVTLAWFCLARLIDSEIWSKICRYLFLFMIPLSFYVALATASRQVLLIQIPLITFLLIERYYKDVGKKGKALFIIMSIFIILSVAQTVMDIYDSSFLAMRAEKDLSEDSRSMLLQDAIKVGLDHFPIGVGAANYIHYSYNHHFSHCSYTELFANNGIVGLGLYVWLIVRFLMLQWRYFQWTRNRQFLVFLFYGLMFAAYQFLYVFYTDLWLISFLVLVGSHSDQYFDELMMQEQCVDCESDYELD